MSIEPQTNKEKRFSRTHALCRVPQGIAFSAVVWAFSLSMLLLSGACAYAAVSAASEETPKVSGTPLAQMAKQTFWDTFQAGNYDRLPEVLKLLTAAYLANPRDPEISLLVAHAHFWKAAERSRKAEQEPTIIDHLILAERYFAESRRLNPEDHRITGWLGALKRALGGIHQDGGLTREGEVMLQESIRLFPEFNYFSAAFPMSGLPTGNERFEEAVEYMWKSTDLCAGETVDRKNPDFGRFMALETTTGPKRVCWNSWIAPHNFEGFSLNMGDILVKRGEVETAKRVYQNAKLSKDYQSWKYRSLLEQRIAKAEERARLFKEADPKNHPDMMLNSPYACMVCHEK